MAEEAPGGTGGGFDALLRPEFEDGGDVAVRAVLAAAFSGPAAVGAAALVRRIDLLISDLDRKLTEQVNSIIHHDAFRALESSWRGLHFLVSRTETGPTLKIRVLNASKRDLVRTSKKATWDRTVLFKEIVDLAYHLHSGEPFGCLVSDHYFDHSPDDVHLLGELSRLAAATHAPFIAGAASGLLGLESWQGLPGPRDPAEIVRAAEYAGWRALRESEESRYVALAMPRFMARLPYRSGAGRVDGFAFEEETGGGDHSRYIWANAAYAMAANITRAFSLYGWCARICGVEGGVVSGPPHHGLADRAAGVGTVGPTEVVDMGNLESQLVDLVGLMPLTRDRAGGSGVFMGAPSLHQTARLDDAAATANARLSASLPYLFAACRFAHYLKSIASHQRGSNKGPEDMEKGLNRWILDNYTESADSEPEGNAPEAFTALRPLAEARVEVAEVPGCPSLYAAKLYIRPRHQLGGMTCPIGVSLHLPGARV